MRKSAALFVILCAGATSSLSIGSIPSPGTITVNLNETMGAIDPRIFGHFTEMTLSSFEGSVSSEMLFNRKFEIQEERNTNPPVFTGVAAGWEPIGLDTSITMVQDNEVFYSPSYSQRITLSQPNSVPAGLQQSGYRYVMPHVSKNQRVDDPFRFEAGERYRVRVAIRSKDFDGTVHVALGESYDRTTARVAFPVSAGGDWRIHTGQLVPADSIQKGKVMIYIDSPGTVWIDSVSLVRADLDAQGFRQDAIELTRRVTPTSIRWPGGWFASDYHWRDGVGSMDRRPARFNRAWNAYTTNDVGTDDFIALCRRVGADPYLTVNLGTGTPEEAAQWVQYCNGARDTEMGRLRAQNGHPEPYGVKLWGIGNEEFLPTLGGTSGRQYGRYFSAFARAMRAVDPSIKLIAVGAFDIPKGVISQSHPLWKIVRYLVDWNSGVLSEAGREIDYYSLHYYNPENVQGQAPDDVNRAALVLGEDLEKKLDRVLKQMGQFAPEGRRYPIALDEWSSAVDNDPNPRDLPAGGGDLAKLGLQVGALTLREALAEATIFNLMQRRPKDFVLASRTLLYAYLRGMIAIRRDRAIATPAGLMMELYSTVDSCQSLRTEVVSGTFNTKTMNPGFAGVKEAKYLDVSARLRSDGKTIDLFVVNRNLEGSIDGTILFNGGPVETDVQAAILGAPALLIWNTFDEPHRVSIQRIGLQASAGSLNYRFPAHSLVAFTFRRKPA